MANASKPTPPPLLTINDVARICRVSEKTVRRMIERRDEQTKDAWLRCPSCAGCFVPRSVWSVLGESDVHPKESSEPALTRFLDSIARFFVG